MLENTSTLVNIPPPALNGHHPSGSALATLDTGEVVTIVIRGKLSESWTGEVLAADGTAIRIRAFASEMGPVSSLETDVMLIPWRNVEWVELAQAGREPPGHLRIGAVRDTAPRLTEQQLLRSATQFQADAHKAKVRGDRRAQHEAESCRDIVRAELDRRNLQALS